MKFTLPSDPRGKLRLVAIVVAALVAMATVAMIAAHIAGWLGDKPAQQAATAKLDTKVQAAEQQTQDEAVEKYTGHMAQSATIKEKEVHYVETIQAAPGASGEMPAAVHDAGIAALRGLRVASGDDSAAAAPLP